MPSFSMWYILHNVMSAVFIVVAGVHKSNQTQRSRCFSINCCIDCFSVVTDDSNFAAIFVPLFLTSYCTFVVLSQLGDYVNLRNYHISRRFFLLSSVALSWQRLLSLWGPRHTPSLHRMTSDFPALCQSPWPTSWGRPDRSVPDWATPVPHSLIKSHSIYTSHSPPVLCKSQCCHPVLAPVYLLESKNT